MKLSADELRRIAALPTEAIPEVLKLLADHLEKDDARRVRDADRKRTTRGQRADIPEEAPPSLFPPTPPYNSPSSPTVETKPRARGERLPEEFYPSLEAIDAIVQELGGVEPGFILRETNKFRDYWTGVSGARGTKLDWPATWRNWMRRAGEQRRPNGHGPPKQAGAMRALREIIEEDGNGKRNFNFGASARDGPEDAG